MDFLQTTIFSVRLWIWLYFLFGILMFLFVFAYYFREQIKKRFYSLKCPEKLIRVVIHFKGNQYKEFWRLVPNNKQLEIESLLYSFNPDRLIKENDVFCAWKEEEKIYTARIDGQEYNIPLPKLVKRRFDRFPEIHFKAGIPAPLNFDTSSADVEFSSDELKMFKENDLFLKLLTLEDQKLREMLILILIGVNAIMTGVILAKTMGWIK